MYKLIFILSIILTGCTTGGEISKSDNTKNNVSGGSKFAIIFMDSLDNKLCKGTLSFDNYEPDSYSGTIKIIKRYVEIFKGSDLISGSFAGSYIRETLQLVLPPKAADYNVYLNLIKNSNGFSGTWTFTTKEGNENKGKVICKKI